MVVGVDDLDPRGRLRLAAKHVGGANDVAEEGPATGDGFGFRFGFEHPVDRIGHIVRRHLAEDAAVLVDEVHAVWILTVYALPSAETVGMPSARSGMSVVVPDRRSRAAART